MAKATWQKNQANLSDLNDVRQFVNQQALALDLDDTGIYDLALAVTEAVTNTIVHGYQGRPGPVTIEIERQAESVMVCVQDQAAHFNPLDISKPNLTIPFEQRPLGGLGIYLIQSGVDRVTHETLPQGGNLLTLFKKITVRRSNQEDSHGNHR